MDLEQGVVFREVQRFRQLSLWVVLLALAGVATWAWINRPVGRPIPPLLLVLPVVSVVFPVALILSARLDVVLRADGIHFRFSPFHLRWQFIALVDIAHHEPRSYRPLLEYGGWGIRGLGANRAYNVSGNRGVQLVLHDGRRVLFGSKRAEEFDRAITTAVAQRA